LSIEQVAPPPTPLDTFTLLYLGRGFDVTVPAINDTGQFAYSLSQGGVTTVFSGSLTSPSTQRVAAIVPDATTTFFTGKSTPADSSERVVLGVRLPGRNIDGLVLASNTSGSSVVTQSGPLVTNIFEPVMSANGTIAVEAEVLSDATGRFENSVVRVDGTGS